MIHEYDQGRLPLVHVDLYRIRTSRELESTGLIEYFSGQTVTAIEWADKGLAALPQDRIEIALTPSCRAEPNNSVDARQGRMSDQVLARLRMQYSKTSRMHRTSPRQTLNEKGNNEVMIRLILVGVLLLLSLAFFLQNQEQEVTLRYFFGLFEASTPIYKPILAGFAVGLLVSGILLFPSMGAEPYRTPQKNQSAARS